MSSDTASMAGNWYSIISHWTVSASFNQSGSSVTGSITYFAKIGICNYKVQGTVNGTAFSLTGQSGQFPQPLCPSMASFTGTIGDQMLAVDQSPWGSFTFRPSGSTEAETGSAPA